MTESPDIAAIVLAAGRSTRMGAANKLTADIGGKPMVRCVVEAALASAASPVLVVTGHQAADVRAALAGLAVAFVDNPDYAAGLSTSLKAGIAAVPDAADSAACWKFYAVDLTALFFKRLALVTTIIVLIMSMEYQTTLRKFVFGTNPQAGLGEFYALPVFTCAGLMWMASAIDFVLIFVSLGALGRMTLEDAQGSWGRRIAILAGLAVLAIAVMLVMRRLRAAGRGPLGAMPSRRY